MQAININLSKIEESDIIHGAKGKYVDLILLENRNGPDQYGNDGFVVQQISKERRAAGERGPIVGNWKRISLREEVPASKEEAEADIPF